MAESGEVNRFAQRLAAILAAIAIAAGGAVWVGCGASDARDQVNKTLDQSQKAIDQAQKKGHEAVKQAQKQANKAVNKATDEANAAVKEAKKQAKDNGY